MRTGPIRDRHGKHMRASLPSRLGAIVVATAFSACSRGPAISLDDLGETGTSGDWAICPALIAESGSLRLVHQAAGGVLERTWCEHALGPIRPAGDAADAPWRNGVVDLGALPAGSFSAAVVRNGVLRADGNVLGWSPALARDSTGALHVAYDTHAAGDYDVIHRAPDGTRTVLAGTSAFEAHASLAIDAGDRVWLAWDQGGARWGRNLGLHDERRVHLAVRDGSGWRRAPPFLPDDVLSLRPSNGPVEGEAVLAELPRVVADTAGPVWLFYRVMLRFPHSGERRSARRVAWQIRALALTRDGVIGPIVLPESSGPNHDTLAALPLPGGGVAAAYETDHRIENFPAVDSWPQSLGAYCTIRAVELRVAGELPPAGPALATGRSEPPTPQPPVDPDPDLVAPGLHRYWGDLHRHSDLSRCKVDYDGSLLDQFRYALDVARLDFVAVTDHSQHVTRGQWAFTVDLSDRLDTATDLTTMYGFEFAGEGGHHNLIGVERGPATDAPFLPGTGRYPFKTFDPSRWIAIPHQIADPLAMLYWRRKQLALEQVVEIFQGRRGSYEAKEAYGRALDANLDVPHVAEYLAARWRFGFIASSDHVSSSRSFAAVLAEDGSRQALFDALRARRCYAATARIALDVRLGDLVMGAAGRVERDAPLVARVAAGAEIARVEVVRGGAVVKRWQGDGSSGLLTVRMGGVDAPLTATLAARDVEFGAALSPLAEPEDSLAVSPDGTLLIHSDAHQIDEDAWVVPVRFPPGATVTLEFAGERRDLDLEELLARPYRIAVDRACCEVRLDPPPLGRDRLDETWRPGDWHRGDYVYVGVVRADGEMAWSSPIWVE